MERQIHVVCHLFDGQSTCKTSRTLPEIHTATGQSTPPTVGPQQLQSWALPNFIIWGTVTPSQCWSLDGLQETPPSSFPELLWPSWFWPSVASFVSCVYVTVKLHSGSAQHPTMIYFSWRSSLHFVSSVILCSCDRSPVSLSRQLIIHLVSSIYH